MSKIKTGTTLTTAYQVEGDTTGALVIQTGASPTTAVTIGSDQSTTLAGTLNLASQNMTPYTGFKNRIINGAMMIDQRNAGASFTPTTTTYYGTCDRWAFYVSQNSKLTAQQGTTVPSNYKNSLGITSSSAYTVLSGDYFTMSQAIEGLNVADLGWGTATASAVTLSFWVRSSLTGTFGGTIQNSAQNRSYPFTYTISAANTWEQKSITIAGDTSGTWLTTNGIGIGLQFSLGVGSSGSGTANTWAGANYLAPTGATSVVSTNGATFYITGVQLEKGSTATSFDYRPYGTELALCQRYYQKWITGSGGNSQYGVGVLNQTNSCARLGAPLPVTMRSTPTFNYSTVRLYDATVATAVTSILANTCSTTNLCVDLAASGGGLTVGRPALLIEGSSSGYIDLTAEL